jgi:invasion protein IalB
MRNTLIGVALAAVFLAGLAFLAWHRQPANISPMSSAASAVEPGFTGVKRIGAWVLACAPIQKDSAPLPLSLTPYGKRGPAKDAGNGFGRCRLSLAFHRKDNPKQVVALLTLRLLKPNRGLAIIAVVPPIVKQGDTLVLRAPPRAVRLPVANCNPQRCIASVVIARKGEIALLSSARRGALVLPAKDGKRRAMMVPLADVEAGINAMRRAEI